MRMFCSSNKTVPGFTDHVINHNGNTIIVKNFPCVEYVQCGEKYYSDEVALSIEAVVNRAKTGMKGKVVLDYNTVL